MHAAKLKLFHSPSSPFVRKVMVCAHEKGLVDRIELIPASPSPIAPDKDVVAYNPSGKIPTLLTTEGTTLQDSRVICAYLDTLDGSPTLYPPAPKDRFAVLAVEALADSILDAALLYRYETVLRPAELRWDEWLAGQMRKVDNGISQISKEYLPFLAGQVNGGAIAVACALGYLDFRFGEKDWRRQNAGLAQWYEQFSGRPSMVNTRPA